MCEDSNVHPCEPAHDSSESAPVFAVPAAGDGWPLTPERMVYDKGPHMASRLHKRAEDLLDYCIDLRPFLEPGETVESASATVGPLSSPLLSIALLEFGPRAVIVWLDGGKNAVSYQISVFIQTSGGRQKLFRFFVRVRGDAAIHSATPGDPGPANVCAGIGPQLVASLTSLTFPPTPVGALSAPIAVTITNVGNVAATIASIVPSDDFTIASDTTGTVAPGESFPLWVRFAPTQVGATGGYVVVDGDDLVEIVLLAQAV